MTQLPDATVERLRLIAEHPDLSETRYEVVELIGRGGMGVVYSALDRELGRLVALKVTGTAASTPDMIARLRREARILARLEHPNIIPVHDVGLLPDGRTFYTMKLVRGRRLDEYVQTGRSLAERLQIFERICDAVAFAHAHGVVHRDLKPPNVMVGAFGEVLILDWGIAKTGPDPGIDPSFPSAAGTIVGTQGFMSPEQARGDPAVDARTDIHALGVMLRFLVQGRYEAHPRDEGRRHPKRLAAIADRATRLDPDDRYQSVPALAEDLARYRDALPVEAYRENLAERLGRIAGRYRVPLALVLAYMVMRLVLLLAVRK